MPDYELVEFPKEEADKLTKELQDVLAKYNGEMGVTSTITLLKRVPKEIISPIQPNGNGDNTDTKEEKAD